MIAHLGMYDAGPANDTFWRLIRHELGYGPEALTQTDDFWAVWRNPDLLFSQTCGYPYRAKLHGNAQLIGTPDYGLPGCPAGYYKSVFICRDDNIRKEMAEFDQTCFAYNEALSQSGWAGPVNHMIAHGIMPESLKETGGHAKSLDAVVNGDADFAALDELTWVLIQTDAPEIANKVRVFASTVPTPTLPFVTSLTQDAGALREAVINAIATLPVDVRAALHLRGLVDIPAETYLAVTSPPSPSELCA